MKTALWLNIVWWSILGVAGYLQAGQDVGSRGTVRERFQDAWKSKESMPELTALDVLYYVALEDVLDTKMSVSNLMNREWFMAVMRTAAVDAGVTNYTSNDLERVYKMHTNGLRMFLISPDLPPRIESWPAPNQSWTNAVLGVSAFIEKHGWSMETNEFLFFPMVRKEPITGLPWPELSKRTFQGVTKGGILYVPLTGFGGESGGVAWNPKTNPFPSEISGFKPLGSGWYAWSQGGPRTAANRRYEGQRPKNGQPED
ncbi:MAG TPA: hypothetical protein VGW37_06085 [Terriglobia bacterium]|nr:hypothetical protein [Terriglobia bacterium]